MQIEFKFDELPLAIGSDREGKPQNIALITGIATINFFRIHSDDQGAGHDWEVVDVTLEGPLLGDPRVPVGPGPLFVWIARSLERWCSEQIVDRITEEDQPDPDAAYERARDDV